VAIARGGGDFAGMKFFKGESLRNSRRARRRESPAIAARLVRVYNWLLRNKHHWMNIIIGVIGPARDARVFFIRAASFMARPL